DVNRRGEGNSRTVDAALAHIAAGSRALTDRMRETVWAINPRCDSVESLADFLAQYAQQFLESAGLSCRLEMPNTIGHVPLQAEVRLQLFSALKEALHNAVKHAAATVVEIRLKVTEQALELEITDNGVGFSKSVLAQRGKGNGLQNLRDRISALG